MDAGSDASLLVAPSAVVPAPSRSLGLIALVVVLAGRPCHASTEPCIGGKAGPFPCDKVDLLAFVPNDVLAGPGTYAGDVWGWEDPMTGDEYALCGMDTGLSVVRITNPEKPVVMGFLPRHTGTSTSFRDVRVYKDHAFIAASATASGLQVLDLRQLRTILTPPATFAETAFYPGLNEAHTLGLNVATGFAYGNRLSGSCPTGGVHIMDVTNPASPTFVTCLGGFGSTHDGQCVIYAGPDVAHVGSEICFNFDGGQIRIIDVTNKSAPVLISAFTYPGVAYSHQGSLTEDHRYIVEDDEFDEYNSGNPTRTRIFDVSDLENPVLIGVYDATTPSTDHNQYVRGRFDYQGNYSAGIRILDLANVSQGILSERGYLDTYPGSDSVGFFGSWGPYPYFGSGIVAELDISKGLLLVKPSLCGLALTGTPLPDGSIGVAYAQTIGATGGSIPYAFASFGRVAPGLTISSTGILSGIPSSAGSFRFHVRATDATDCDHTETLTLIVHAVGCPAVSVSPASLPGGIDEVGYAQTLTASGGTGPYRFAMTGGALPVELALTQTGAISGTPTVPGTSTFRVSSTDAAGCTGSGSFTVAIAAQPCGAIVLSPRTLLAGWLGASYTDQISATGGTPPHLFTLRSGSLPAGLTLSSSGRVSGIASGAGTPFTVVATDATGCAGSSAYLIDVDFAYITDYIVGQGAGQPNPNEVRAYYYKANNPYLTFLAYAAGAWGVNVGSGNVDGNTEAEILTGPGPGATLGPQVRAFDVYGVPLAKVNFFAYGTLKFGAIASGAALDTDAFDEILTGAGPGAVFGPHVRGFNYDAAAVTAMGKVSYFAYGTLKYGVDVERSDVDGDSFAEILAAPGPGVGFGPQVRGFDYDGAAVAAIAKINFNAFTTIQYGANVSGGDVDADGFGEIAAAGGAGPIIAATFRGFDYGVSGVLPLPGFDVTPYGTFYGGRVALSRVDYSVSEAQLLTGPGPDPAAGATLDVYTYDGAALTQSDTLPAFTSSYGVNVGAGSLGR